MARHDALTNLPNRVLFQDKMEQALERGDELAVMFLDLDRFKAVNDSLGHSVGDALLCAVTERLQRVVPGADTVARLGGDEFAIVQVSAKPTDASELASRIIDTLVEPFDVLGHQVIIGTRIGIAHGAGRRQRTRPAVAQRRYGALPRQGEGRGTYHFFQPEMDAQMQERRKLELDLRKALLADNSSCTTSRWSKSAAARSPASRRCCAGTIRNAAWCRPTSSFRSPRKSASSCRSATGCSSKPAGTP